MEYSAINATYRFDPKRLKPALRCLVCSAVVILFIECLVRHSLFAGLRFAFGSPIAFIHNVLIILFTLSFTQLLPRRRAAALVVCALWLALGTADFIVQLFRVTPLSANDISMLPSVWSIVFIYLRKWQFVLIAAAIILLAALLVFAVLKTKPEKVDFLASVSLVAVSSVLLLLFHAVGINHGSVSSDFANLPEDYKSYGFVYCFSSSLIDQGIKRPDNYSEETVDNILEAIGAQDAPSGGQKPNIVFVQLESFIDVKRVKGLSFSRDPAPNFSALRDSCPSGLLTVPAIGAGTVNTEFEVLTGMSKEYFGAGEYPFETVLREKTCESLCYDLKALGYASHAVHNNTATFYDRNLVYPNLGFDSFTSIEYMNGVEYNPLGWARDSVLTGEIVKALNSTVSRDLVYAVSVQPHGKYPSEPLGEKQPVSVLGPSDEAEACRYKYYVNQIYDCDKFIGELTEALSDYPEPVVAVFFGDHFPNLDLSDEMLSYGGVFDTEYFIWSNCGAEEGFEDRNLHSYQLGARVLEMLDIDSGVLTKLHQRYAGSSIYSETLEMLEYNLFYGSDIPEEGLYAPSDMKMGTGKILALSYSVDGGRLTLHGYGFTPFSAIMLNGEILETEFVSPLEIAAVDTVEQDQDIESLSCVQVSGDDTVLSEAPLIGELEQPPQSE